MYESIDDPKSCEHDWLPVSMVFETRLVEPPSLGSGGRYVIAPFPDSDKGRVYLVCLRCSSHTYMETSWARHRLYGSTDRDNPDALEEQERGRVRA